MPEEVIYATLQFPDSSKLKKFEENYSLKRTDSHEMPEMEMDGETENKAGGVESRAEMAQSRPVTGPKAPSRVWCTVAFISLTMNLLVLAGLGTLHLMNYQELIFGNRTVDDIQQSTIQRLEKNVTLYMNMYDNISREYISFKSMIEDRLQELSFFTSKYCEDLKQKENYVEFHLCFDSWMWHGNSSSRPHSQVDMNNKSNYYKSQLYITCLPSPFSWMDLNCSLKKTNEAAENVVWTPIKIPSVENSEVCRIQQK
ncbi:C-type lectin domain family 12 member A-like [Crocuta crocuta]